MRTFAWLGLFTAVACSQPASSGGSSEDPTAAGEGAITGTTADAQREAIVVKAQQSAAGQPPSGHCYAAVARYIDSVGYGNFKKLTPGAVGSLPEIPAAYHGFAHDFADYVNAGHAEELGLTKLDIDNPYEAPRGAIVVVRAGTPGTSHPTAGDIVVADGKGAFYNDGQMGYGGAANFPPGNDFVLGVYVPTGSTLSH